MAKSGTGLRAQVVRRANRKRKSPAHQQEGATNKTKAKGRVQKRKLDLESQRGNALSKIYRTLTHVDGYNALPQYQIRADKIYRTVTHVGGYNALPQYEIRGNQIYRAVTHVDGYNALPQYEISDNLIFRTVTHVRGYNALAQYEIRDD